MRETSLPGELNAIKELMGKKLIVGTCQGGYFSDVWNVKKGVRQRALIYWILHSFYQMMSSLD